MTQGNRQSRADVELWDCSGSSRFSTSWPAIVWELHGVIFVFNPDNESHGADLDFYYDNFVKKSGLQDSNCIVFAHVRGGSSNKKAKLCNEIILQADIKSFCNLTFAFLAKNFGRIPQLEVNLEDEANGMRADFQRFIGTLASNLSERRDQVEMNIMSMRG